MDEVEQAIEAWQRWEDDVLDDAGVNTAEDMSKRQRRAEINSRSGQLPVGRWRNARADREPD